MYNVHKSIIYTHRGQYPFLDYILLQIVESETISARFSKEILAEIDKLVESGDFGSRGEFVQYAVRKMLKSNVPRFPPS